jgi:hypothetical protein
MVPSPERSIMKQRNAIVPKGTETMSELKLPTNRQKGIVSPKKSFTEKLI